jgi:non-ribosomal peptide synthetase component F
MREYIQYILYLFYEQVDQTPDSLAVVADDVALTYRELNERANRCDMHITVNLILLHSTTYLNP